MWLIPFNLSGRFRSILPDVQRAKVLETIRQLFRHLSGSEMNPPISVHFITPSQLIGRPLVKSVTTLRPRKVKTLCNTIMAFPTQR